MDTYLCIYSLGREQNGPNRTAAAQNTSVYIAGSDVGAVIEVSNAPWRVVMHSRALDGCIDVDAPSLMLMKG